MKPLILVFVFATLAAPARILGQTLDGVWQSEGYGNLYDIRGDTLTVLEVTQISCLDARTATRLAGPPPGVEASFRLVGAAAVLQVLATSDPDRKRFHPNGAASDIIARRIPAKPDRCQSPPANTPEFMFDVFAATWAEQYGFFDLKGIDWSKVVADNRPRVAAATTPEQFFGILQSMIEPFGDAHSGIDAPALQRHFNGRRFGPRYLDDAERTQAFDIVEKRYLRGPIRSWCNGKVQFGRLDGDLGYLRIRSFAGYAADEPNIVDQFEAGRRALETALDSILGGGPELRGLIVDVRLNGGGADPYGLAIASRLATSEYLAYAKQARAEPLNPSAWTPEQPSVVRPSTRPGFRGEIALLTGPQSISGAETFTQALINRRPRVVRIGEPTQGVFSDVLDRRLPNGWRFGLPNERFVTDGKSFDGPGIPPDIVVPIFPASDLAAGRDGALEKAMEVVRVSARR